MNEWWNELSILPPRASPVIGDRGPSHATGFCLRYARSVPLGEAALSAARSRQSGAKRGLRRQSGGGIPRRPRGIPPGAQAPTGNGKESGGKEAKESASKEKDADDKSSKKAALSGKPAN